MDKNYIFLVVAITMIVIIAIVILKKHKSNTKEGMKLVRGSQMPPIARPGDSCPAGTLNISANLAGLYLPCTSTTPNGSITDCYNNCNAGNYAASQQHGPGMFDNSECIYICKSVLDNYNIPHCDTPCGVYPNECSAKTLKCTSVIGN